MAELPIVPVRKVTDAPPRALLAHPSRPLEGVKVICATHAIAGPSAARTLAEHGATVLQIMYTHGFEHDFVYTYANLGSASSRLNFNKQSDCQQMWRLIRDADVWIDSYREGALSKFGFTDDSMLEANPGLIISHVRLYGTTGDWASRPGFDMQGSASSGLMAHCGGGIATPKWPPGMVINDYTTGYFGALAIQATLLRRMREGGGYILSPSLTKTAMTILKHFKTDGSARLLSSRHAALPPEEIELITGMGILKTLKLLPVLSRTPIYYETVLRPQGSCFPVFPSNEQGFDVHTIACMRKKNVMDLIDDAAKKKTQLLRTVARQSSSHDHVCS